MNSFAQRIYSFVLHNLKAYTFLILGKDSINVLDLTLQVSSSQVFLKENYIKGVEHYSSFHMSLKTVNTKPPLGGFYLQLRGRPITGKCHLKDDLHIFKSSPLP